jgi:hypothetical protein
MQTWFFVGMIFAHYFTPSVKKLPEGEGMHVHANHV